MTENTTNHDSDSERCACGAETNGLGICTPCLIRTNTLIRNASRITVGELIDTLNGAPR